MKHINAEFIKSTKSLYNDIDSCIDELLKARVGHNQENEGKALFRMEGLMVATLQQLDCILDFLQQEQQEVDIKKEIKDWCKENVTGVNPIYTADSLMCALLPKCAHYFYKLGLNARKEE